MAKIERGVRLTGVPADLEALAYARNREDAPVLARCREEVNLLQGDRKDIDEDYIASPGDGTLYVDTDGAERNIYLPKIVDDDGNYLKELEGKHIRIRRSGANNVVVKDFDGNTLNTINIDLRCYLFEAHLGTWYRLTI